MKKKKKTSCFGSQRAVLRKSRFDRKYSCCCCVAIRGCRINPFLFGLFYYYSQTLKDLLLPKIIAFNPFLCRVLRVPVPPMLLPPMYWWYKNKPSFCPYHMLIFRIFDALKEYKKLRYSWLRNHFNPFFYLLLSDLASWRIYYFQEEWLCQITKRGYRFGIRGTNFSANSSTRCCRSLSGGKVVI